MFISAVLVNPDTFFFPVYTELIIFISSALLPSAAFAVPTGTGLAVGNGVAVGSAVGSGVLVGTIVGEGVAVIVIIGVGVITSTSFGIAVGISLGTGVLSNALPEILSSVSLNKLSSSPELSLETSSVVSGIGVAVTCASILILIEFSFISTHSPEAVYSCGQIVPL